MSSTRPTGVPVCFTPVKQQLPGAEASVGDIVRMGDNPVASSYYYVGAGVRALLHVRDCDRMIENMGRSYTLVENPQHAIQFHLEGHDLRK